MHVHTHSRATCVVVTRTHRTMRCVQMNMLKGLGAIIKTYCSTIHRVYKVYDINQSKCVSEQQAPVHLCNRTHALTFLTFTPQVGIPRVETVSNSKKIKEFIAFKCNAHTSHTRTLTEGERGKASENGHTARLPRNLLWCKPVVRVFDQKKFPSYTRNNETH